MNVENYWEGRLYERQLILEMLRDREAVFEVKADYAIANKDVETARFNSFRVMLCDGLAQSIEREEHMK